MDELVFGTDGWRDIIGERFTFGNLGRAAQAYAEYLKDQDAKLVLVGYDTRFNNPLFARRVAEVLAANGLEVRLADAYLPTPALSFAVKHYGAAGGVMLTASHNPPAYSGFKLKGAYGGTATQDIYQAVSQRLVNLEGADVATFDLQRHQVASFDIRPAYFAQLASLIDTNCLKTFEGVIIHEAMGGSGTGWLRQFFEHIGLVGRLEDLHPEASPLFYGVNPEPIPGNLAVAMRRMAVESTGLLIATDGDADRIGVVLPGGQFFNPHQIFAVLLAHLQRKGLSGRVVKTFTVSRVLERYAKLHGLEVHETPVGFKYIVDAMLAGDVLIGGEESGGIGTNLHIPERDGLANGLLLLEAMALSGKSLAEMFSEIEAATSWQHAYDRLDLHLQGNALKDAVMRSLSPAPARFAERSVESSETLDGIKLNLSGNAWLMFRASGTEPVLRIYCEAATEAEVAGLLRDAHDYVQGFEK